MLCVVCVCVLCVRVAKLGLTVQGESWGFFNLGASYRWQGGSLGEEPSARCESLGGGSGAVLGFLMRKSFSTTK